MAKRTTTKPAKKPARAKKTAARKPQQARKPSREDLFVLEYMKDLNGRQAAMRAGYSPQSARQTASDLLAEPRVQEKVQKAMDERAARTQVEADQVVSRLWGIATADARDLIELHRSCCRYCWGKEHFYQWTPQELRTAKLDYQREVAVANEQQLKLLRAPDETGGIGFDPRRDPNPACPECFGDGVERVVPKDTRDLPPAARLLYAGVKTTQHGLEIKTHDQLGALRDVGRHHGIFKDKVEVTGKNGGPLKHAHQTVQDILADIDGAGTGLPAHDRRD
ncbi:terminase small subunit [Dyella sp. 2RAB6]|uniref:terminase small subunit n=1 Tax=Dyella sp. 2RAB6 TaxID=3232992 RepID=UPI003F9034EE